MHEAVRNPPIDPNPHAFAVLLKADGKDIVKKSTGRKGRRAVLLLFAHDRGR